MSEFADTHQLVVSRTGCVANTCYFTQDFTNIIIVCTCIDLVIVV